LRGAKGGVHRTGEGGGRPIFLVALRAHLFFLLALLQAGCEPPDRPPRLGDRGGAGSYDVEVTWTDYGIPHVRAGDWGSVGYGLGYAYAEENICLLLDKVLQVRGERSRYLGPDHPAQMGTSVEVSSLASDLFYRSRYDRDALARAYRRTGSEVSEITKGYAAGVNRYLRETGVENLPEPCRGAEWAGPVEEEDLYLWYASLASLAGNQLFVEAIAAARPPGTEGGEREASRLPAPPSRPDRVGGMGSNAWAFGSEASENGRGLLFGNPHWVWGNMNQFYMAHLTIPGEVDIMGAVYGGTPFVVIGFNRSVAWSHTVSTGSRVVIRELRLEPGSPTTYRVDGEPHSMETAEVQVEVRGENGTLEREARTLYTTEFGPVIVQRGMPWTDSTAYALTDLNRLNHRLPIQWLDLARAPDVKAVRERLARVLGIPWVNTIAADAEGGALYADVSVKPFVTDVMLERCAGSATARRATASGLLTLDGSTRGCDPRSDPSAPQPGILPPELLPVLERRDYVANSNNSYWLTHADEPITGLPRVNGGEGEPLSFRAQEGLRTIEARLEGRDGLPGDRFGRDEVRTLVFGDPERPGYGHRNRAAEVILDALLRACEGDEGGPGGEGGWGSVEEACRVLAGWDRRHALGSVGAHIFREFWERADRIPGLWATPFDPEAPLETPRDPDVEAPEVREALLGALAAGIEALEERGIALDRPWGELQTHRMGGEEVPVPGNDRNVLNMIVAPPGPGGYGPVVHGTSYVQIVGFDDEGPVADAVLLYGQSTDPASSHYHDQLRELWLEGSWLRLPYAPEEIGDREVRSVQLRDGPGE